MKRVHAFHIELEFESFGFKCWFLRRGENRSTRRKKRLEQKRETTTNLTTPGFEPLSPCRKASALTTALPLLANAENYMQL